MALPVWVGVLLAARYWASARAIAAWQHQFADETDEQPKADLRQSRRQMPGEAVGDVSHTAPDSRAPQCANEHTPSGETRAGIPRWPTSQSRPLARRNSKSLPCQAPGRANVRVAIRLPDFAIVVHDRGRPIFNDGISAKGIPPCHSCHGPGGAGNEKFPRLAGQHADYLVKQLTVFQRTDERPEGSIMKTVAHELTQENIIDVAAYLQALPYQKAP